MTIKDLMEKLDLKNSDIDEIDLFDIHEGTVYEFGENYDSINEIKGFEKHEIKDFSIYNYEGKLNLSISFV